MNRRGFLGYGCACGLGFVHPGAFSQTAVSRFNRPDIATDEGGLWALMDREETRLRRSPFSLQDRSLRDYVQDIACRLAGEHCPDIRVHLVRNPLFNASMAPNGMMQVWTGLILRAENEAQLAAVIGHEIGHYLGRHSLERLRDIKSRSAFGQFLGLFGIIGAIGQIAVIAGALAYSRDQEREADEVGLALMRKAGYEPAEASKVWDNLLTELKARPDGDPATTNPLFATHPSPEERRDTLVKLALLNPGGATHEEAWLQKTRPFRKEWLQDELKRGQRDESFALFTRMIARFPAHAEVRYARGEMHRLRGAEGDLDAALADFGAAVSIGDEPPETHRGLGMIQRLRKDAQAAKSSFERYLQLAPNAADSAMIKTYLEDPVS